MNNSTIFELDRDRFVVELHQESAMSATSLLVTATYLTSFMMGDAEPESDRVTVLKVTRGSRGNARGYFRQ